MNYRFSTRREVGKVGDSVKKPVTETEENVTAALCYIPVIGVLPAAAFLITGKSEPVRWNAVQAIVLWVAVVVCDVLLGISVIGNRFIPVVNLIGMFVIPLALAIKANQKEPTRLPVLGEVTDKLLKGKK